MKTKQQLKNELLEIEMGIDFCIKKIEILSSRKSDRNQEEIAKEIEEYGKLLDELYPKKEKINKQIERMKNNA